MTGRQAGELPTSSRHRSIMASSAEPPPKKRKLVEAQTPSPSGTPRPPPPLPPGLPPTPPPPETLAAAAPSAPPPPPQSPPPTPEELHRKRSNREELRKLFECYRRIRLCVERKDARLMPELEQVYLALITASRGCTSVQRILAKLIPQYASYCPTALEAAAKVSIKMYNWNLAIVTRGEDADGVAYRTARACIVGLVDICSTASLEAPKSSVITGICSAVYMTVLTFFISTFDGKDIHHIGSRRLSKLQDPMELLEILKQESGDDSQLAHDCLFELRAQSLLCIFLLSPENLLEACFALIASAETDHIRGLYFLNQLTCNMSNGISDLALDNNADVASQCTEMEIDLSGTKEIVDSKPSSDASGVSGRSMVESNECYITMAISRHPSLRGWLLRRYKKLCDSCGSTVLSEVSSCLKVLGSLSELDEDKSSMDCEPSVLEKPDKSAGEKTVNIDTHVLKSVQTDDVKTEKLADAKTGGRKSARPDLYVASVSSDVISVSKELWVGSLGNSAAEALVRSKFEEFGPLTNFLFYPSKEFALIEYGNIVHAVRACGYMRGSSIWGGDLQIRYLDRLIGSKGFVGGIAVGESCHIYVGKVKNQKEKDEVFDELKSAGLKRPCGCIDISGENAFILEFETSVDAAVAKAHIRRQAHSDVCSQDKNTSVHQLLVHNMDKSIPETEFINAFSRFGEVSRWQFNRIDGSCLIDYESHSAAACAKSQMHGARFGLKLISVESRTCSVGAVHDKTFSPVIRMPAQNLPDSSSHHEISDGNICRNPRVSAYHTGYTVQGDRPIYGPPPPNTQQLWQYKDLESNRAPQGMPPCPPVSAHRSSVMPPPPPPIQTSFVRPVYPGPGSPWENTTPNPPFGRVSPRIVSPRMMPGSSFRIPSAPPFIPSCVTPRTPIPNVAPSPFTPLDMPPPPLSPPPLPVSEPPSVPPPPSSPPAQPSTDPCNSQKPCPHPQWQGSLTKSGIHYCTIYASRIELDACRYGSTVSEPAEWPSRLDVLKRTAFQHAKTIISNAPPNKKEVCRLLPCSNDDQKGFRDFISYLKLNKYAGVIKIAPVKPMGSRLLFILPPTSEVFGLLGLPPQPTECLIAVVLPKETTTEVS
ncbi:hypothetical protein CFC21_048183 [Triticum aestivum]|uniref:RRM domain-containing protein n=2 Tax=Triticum aestivum TaxID=4565 RepID=A0A3B6GZR1_WHEAT|nr:uncharacterized protein LOC123079276 isoform X1 [Triticum aestivum]KAF7037909.1 hypothetical protein CFC21_048183 [Triticum aestivum]